MSTPEKTAPKAPPAAQPRRRKWLKRLAIAAGVLVVLAAALLFAAREYYRAVGERELAGVTAKLDAEDPGWRLDDIQAARVAGFPPDAENSATVVAEVIRLLPPNNHPLIPTGTRFLPRWAASPPSNRLPSEEERAAAGEEMEGTGAAIAEAMLLRNMPRGGRPLTFRPGAFDANTDHARDSRMVGSLLLCEAELAALRGESAAATEAARAAVSAGRAIGDEPMLYSQLARLRNSTAVARTAVRLLAWGRPETGLAELQSALLAEADEPYFRRAARGERAAVSAVYDLQREGRGMADLAGRDIHPGQDLESRLFQWWHRRMLAGDQAFYLTLMGENLGVDGLSYPEQAAAATRVEAMIRTQTSSVLGTARHLWAYQLALSGRGLSETVAAGRAELGAAAALLACERFRIARGRWPESPAEIPPDVLRAWPADPFDDKPLRFRRLSDGIAAYSIGRDGTDDGGTFHKIQPQTLAELQTRGFDIGFRLWDADKRGLPPLPPEAPEPPEVEP